MLTDIIETPEQLDTILDNPTLVGGKRYPNLLKDFRDQGRTEAIWMLHNGDRFVPGYGPGEDLSGVVLWAQVRSNIPACSCQLWHTCYR